MEVRETQSYTAVAKYTDQATMDGKARWGKNNMAAANMVAFSSKVR